MIFNLGSAERRIYGNRNTPGHEHAEECLEEGGSRRQHDGDALSGQCPQLKQPGSDDTRGAIEFAIGNALLHLIADPKQDVRAVAMAPYMEIEHLEKRACMQGFNRFGR